MNPNWSDLPDDSLTLIADRLDSPLELIRFRSICRSWRSSSTHKRFRNFSPQISSLMGFKDSYLTLTTYFHIKPSSSSSRGWLIKLEHLKSGKIRCLSPLSKLPIHHSSELLDFFELQVSRVYETPAIIRQKEERIAGEFRRVVLFPDSMEPPRILSIALNEKLRYWNHEGERWTRLWKENLHDMISHKSQIYVVDDLGRVYWVNHSLHLIQYAPPVGTRTWRKHLVESNGELYVVDRCLAGRTRIGQVVDFPFLTRYGIDRKDYCSITICDNNGSKLCNVLTHSDSKTVAFNVYKLDEELGRWEKVKPLNGQAFVIATDCCFSISACEFDGCLENSIYFTDEQDGENPGIGLNGHDLSVFSLNDGSIKKIFCPSFLQM